MTICVHKPRLEDIARHLTFFKEKNTMSEEYDFIQKILKSAFRFLFCRFAEDLIGRSSNIFGIFGWLSSCIFNVVLSSYRFMDLLVNCVGGQPVNEYTGPRWKTSERT